MKTLFIMLVALIALSIPAISQSDCGNCWTVWVGCDPLAICDFQGLCDVCSYFIECDYAPCSTTQAQWACVCPTGAAAPTASCLNNQMKHAVLKQKLVDRAQLRLSYVRAQQASLSWRLLNATNKLIKSLGFQV